MFLSPALMRARRQSARGTRARDGTRKKLDGLCLGVYYFGSRWEDVIGTEAAGVKDWVGKGFMQGPTSCHMCTEKQHLIVSSLGRPQGKEEPRKGRKAYRLPPRGRGPPFPGGPLWHCGRERQFLSPKKYNPFDPGRSKKRNGPRSRNNTACICRSQAARVGSEIQYRVKDLEGSREPDSERAIVPGGHRRGLGKQVAAV